MLLPSSIIWIKVKDSIPESNQMYSSNLCITVKPKLCMCSFQKLNKYLKAVFTWTRRWSLFANRKGAKEVEKPIFLSLVPSTEPWLLVAYHHILLHSVSVNSQKKSFFFSSVKEVGAFEQSWKTFKVSHEYTSSTELR